MLRRQQRDNFEFRIANFGFEKTILELYLPPICDFCLLSSVVYPLTSNPCLTVSLSPRSPATRCKLSVASCISLCSMLYALCSLLLDNGKIDSLFLDQFLFHSTMVVVDDLEHLLHVLRTTDKPESVPRADYP